MNPAIVLILESPSRDTFFFFFRKKEFRVALVTPNNYIVQQARELYTKEGEPLTAFRHSVVYRSKSAALLQAIRLRYEYRECAPEFVVRIDNRKMKSSFPIFPNEPLAKKPQVIHLVGGRR